MEPFYLWRIGHPTKATDCVPVTAEKGNLCLPCVVRSPHEIKFLVSRKSVFDEQSNRLLLKGLFDAHALHEKGFRLELLAHLSRLQRVCSARVC